MSPTQSLDMKSSPKIIPILENSQRQEIVDLDAKPIDHKYELDLWKQMAEHMRLTKRLMDCNMTLSFRNQLIEQSYTNFVGEKYKQSWSLVTIFGVIFMIIFQLIFYLVWNDKGTLGLEALILPIVYLPCILIITAVYTLNREFIAKWIQLLGSIYIILLGPVFVVCKTVLITQFHPLVSAAFYITNLFCFTYFLRLRFVYCLGVCFVVFPTWLTVAILDKSIENQSSVFEQSLFQWNIVSLLVACFIVCAVSYRQERTSRLQFISNYSLMMKNSQMTTQLQGLENTFSTTLADLDSPLEKAIATLKALLASQSVTVEQIGMIQQILFYLNSSHLLTPDLYTQVQQGGVLLDKEEQNWLFNELAHGQVETIHNSTMSFKSLKTDSDENEEKFDIETYLTTDTVTLLNRIDEYNFPIFELAKGTQQRPLTLVAYKIVVESGILARLNLQTEIFLNFMIDIENGYRADLSCK